MPRAYRVTSKAATSPLISVFLNSFGLLAAAALIVLAGQVRAENLTGTPRIIDGDTIEIAGERVRLHGIDAPEQNQLCSVSGVATPCGQQATGMLQVLATDGAFHCRGEKRDRYGRLIAVCFAGDQNLNAELVRRGWALAYRRYSKDYVAQEVDARTNGRGMWRGVFVDPWDWRRGDRLPTLTASDGDAG